MSEITGGQSGVHIILQGKGGVGKSLSAILLAQYLLEKKVGLSCFDTDPVNQTFASFPALRATHLNILINNRINEQAFDTLIEKILTDKSVYVVDNGASSFIPIGNYLIQNDVLSLLGDAGVPVFIHCVVTGGQALTDTLSGFDALAKMTTAQNIIIWKNEYFGEVTANGKSLEEMKAFVTHRDKVRGIVTLKEQNPDTFGRDLRKMLAAGLTFAEGIKSEQFFIMEKSRLHRMQRDIFSQLDALDLNHGF